MNQSADVHEGDADEHAVRTVSRRTVLAGAGTAVAISLAGCSMLADQLGEMVLEDVNVFNGTGEQISGTLEVVGPDGETVLSESFDIEASEEEGDGDGGNEDESTDAEVETEGGETYADVWQDAGEYEVTVELDDGFEIGGETSAEETVTIDDPDEEMLAVFLGGEEGSGIHFTTGNSLSDFDDSSDAA